ncbi:MAG: HEAT repeat domain-containing protein [Methanosarcinales archaeon]|nr:HEAT repeat domain-containing protein [Methanosarcinales archaeon]
MNKMKVTPLVPLIVIVAIVAAAISSAPVMCAAGDGGDGGEDVIVDAADSERVLLDYSIDTIDVVLMNTENYYVVGYKNVVCGRGIVIFADDGTIVTDEAVVGNVLEAVAWGEVASQISVEDVEAIRTAVESSRAIETSRSSLTTSCNSLAVLVNSISGSNDTDYAVLSVFSGRVLNVDEGMTEIMNGTEFFLSSMADHQKKISAIADSANSTKKSLYKDWEKRGHAKTQVYVTLVLAVIILIIAVALIFVRSKKTELSIKKRAHKLVERKKTNIIDQMHSPDSDERARSALMAGASTEINESTIPHLIVLLDDPDDRVRANAAQSIRRIGQKDKNLVQFAIDPLKRHLNDPNDKVRDAVAEAYQVACGDLPATATEAAAPADASPAEPTEHVKKPAAAESGVAEEKVKAKAKAVDAAKAQLSDIQRQRLRELRQSVNRSINDLPVGCDLCIPYYLTGICTTAISMVEHADRAESEMLDGMIDAVETMTKHIIDLIENGRFVDICISKNMGAFDDSEFAVGVGEYLDQLNALISDPVGFADSLHVEEELWSLDGKITGKMGELTIIPISGLWRVSKSVFDDASDESGIKRAFLVLIAWFIMGRVREMMENPDIVRRLRL